MIDGVPPEVREELHRLQQRHRELLSRMPISLAQAKNPDFDFQNDFDFSKLDEIEMLASDGAPERK